MDHHRGRPEHDDYSAARGILTDIRHPPERHLGSEQEIAVAVNENLGP
jgi:hypothetical protein